MAFIDGKVSLYFYSVVVPHNWFGLLLPLLLLLLLAWFLQRVWQLLHYYVLLFVCATLWRCMHALQLLLLILQGGCNIVAGGHGCMVYAIIIGIQGVGDISLVSPPLLNSCICPKLALKIWLLKLSKMRVDLRPKNFWFIKTFWAYEVTIFYCPLPLKKLSVNTCINKLRRKVYEPPRCCSRVLLQVKDVFACFYLMCTVKSNLFESFILVKKKIADEQ